MERKFRSPTLMIAVAMLMLVTGGFLAVLQVGISARRSQGINHGFSFRDGGKKERGYFEDLERGSDIIKTKASDFFAGIFGGGAAVRPQGGYASAAGGYRGYSADEIAGKYAPEDDAFEKYYRENYGSGSPDYSAASSYGGGDSFYGGGGGGGSSQDLPSGAAAPAGRSGPGPGAVAAASGAGSPGGAPGPLRNTARLAGDSAAPKLYASLPSRSPDRGGYGLPAAGGDNGSGFQGYGKTPGKGGGLDSFRGGGAAKDLDGALESGRTDSASSYNAKMSGGAAAAAAASGGGTAPAASAAEKVSGGGASGGASAGGDSGAGAAPQNFSDSGTQDAGDQKTFIPGDLQGGDDGDKPFLEGVVVEKRNGKDTRYVTEEEAAAKLEEGQLKAGAAGNDETSRDKDREKRSDHVRAPLPPDPEKFEELSPERKLELKKRIHTFLKRVERRYGAMEDIFYTPCAADDELCQEHELTEGYLTLETSNSAELHLGLKYINERWRRYTVGFSIFDLKDGNSRRRPRSR